MRIARLKLPEGVFYASLKEDGYHLILGDIFAEWGELSEPYLGECTLLPPVSPSKVVCLGANYKKHAEELHLEMLPEPTIFLKPKSSVIASGEDILYPSSATKVDYEAELAVVHGLRIPGHVLERIVVGKIDADLAVADLDEGRYTAVKLLAGVCGTHLHADTCLIFRHDRIVEARDVDAFLL